MKPERWQRIEKLFHSALELSPEERRAFLDRACAGDESLRREVESLLESDEQVDSLIESPAIEAAARLASDDRDRSVIERRIGHYEIISLIAEGGMGKVYLAEDGRLGRKVALKFLHATFTTDEERVRRFEQEARAASALNHPNIITIYDVGQIDGRRFLVSEYVEGETLRQRIGGSRVSLSEMLDIVIQAAGALAAAHQAGIIHRDIKPENIMIRPDGYVKVVDFGLAKLTEQHAAGRDGQATAAVRVETESGVVMGTVRYMSPEQARGTNLDARTDIFSLGVVIYEMVTGRAPFDGETPSHVIVEILDKEPRPLSDHWPAAPAELQRIVSKALAKDRSERYQSVNDLLADLKLFREQLQTGERFETIRYRGPDEEIGPGLVRSAPRRGTWSRPGLLIPAAAVAALAIALIAWFYILRPAPQAPALLKTVPLTSLAGREEWPAFSPDGSKAAFAWNRGEGEDFDIYVKLVDAGTPLRLTDHPGVEVSPAWSPDGRHIAFTRLHGSESGIYIVPALGGPERRLQALGFNRSWYGEPLLVTWSPAEGLLAYPDKGSPQSPPAIYLLSVETLEKRRLTEPSGQDLGDWYPAFSPDGRTLAFTRWTSEGVMDIYVVPTRGGEPRRLTFDNTWIKGLCWTSDGDGIVFSSLREGSHRLWRASVSDGSLEPLALGGDQALPTGLRSPPSISRAGHSLIYSLPLDDVNIWRYEIAGPASQRAAPGRLIFSSKYDGMPQISPDGRKIVFQSERTGIGEIWLADSDGSNQVQLTYIGSPLVGTPRWSPEGRYIAFDARQEDHSDIYVVGSEGGPARRVTTESFNDIVPSWSRDGKWIYFCSNRSGALQVWKVAADGGEPAQVTQRGGFAAIESVDSKSLYYTKPDASGLWKMPVEGGEESMVFDLIKPDYWGYWVPVDDGIYFVNPDAGPRPSIEFFDFATRRVAQVAILQKPVDISPPGLAVSPDGRWLLCNQIDQSESDIMLVENFR